MTQVYRTLRVARSDKGALGVVIDAPPMKLIGPELVHDLVGLLGALESGQETRVVVLESADPGLFRPARRPDQGRGVHRRSGQGGRPG